MKTIFASQIRILLFRLPFCALVAVVLLLCGAGCANVRNAPPGLVSRWSGEGNSLDSIGHNDGTPLGSPTFRPGKIGQAFAFSGHNQCVFVPDSASLHFTNAFTVEAWIFPTQSGNPNSYSILVKYDGVLGVERSAFGFSITGDSALYLIVSRDGVHTHCAQVNSSSRIPTDAWTHVAATYDGSALRLYINGNLDATLPYSGGIYPGTDDMAIGANVGGMRPGSMAAPFVGLIDELSVYNRALSPAQIKSIYQAAKAR